MNNKIEDLHRRVKKTARSKYRASKRLEQHYRFAQCTIALLICLMLFIPLSLLMQVETGYSDKYLYLGQVLVAGCVLFYTFLLSQERFTLRSEFMNRDGVDLSKLARKLEGLMDREVAEEEYHTLVNLYYDLLEKSESHKTIDFMFIRLEFKPTTTQEWVSYVIDVIKAYSWYFLLFIHYLIALVVAVTGLFLLIYGVFENSKQPF